MPTGDSDDEGIFKEASGFGAAAAPDRIAAPSWDVAPQEKILGNPMMAMRAKKKKGAGKKKKKQGGIATVKRTKKIAKSDGRESKNATMKRLGVGGKGGRASALGRGGRGKKKLLGGKRRLGGKKRSSKSMADSDSDDDSEPAAAAPKSIGNRMRRMSMRVVSALSFRKGSDASSGSSGESAIGSGISTSSTGGVAAASPKGLRRMSMRIKAVLTRRPSVSAGSADDAGVTSAAAFDSATGADAEGGGATNTPARRESATEAAAAAMAIIASEALDDLLAEDGDREAKSHRAGEAEDSVLCSATTIATCAVANGDEAESPISTAHADFKNHFASMRGVPNGWRTELDPTTGVRSYINERTGAAQNELPCADAIAEEEAAAALVLATAAEALSRSVPHGWAAHTDEASGAVYYYHAGTGATSWEFPGEDESGSAISLSITGNNEQLWWEEFHLSVGTLVTHNERGAGTIVLLESDDLQRVHVTFSDGGETHRYKKESWSKLFTAHDAFMQAGMLMFADDELAVDSVQISTARALLSPTESALEDASMNSRRPVSPVATNTISPLAIRMQQRSEATTIAAGTEDDVKISTARGLLSPSNSTNGSSDCMGTSTYGGSRSSLAKKIAQSRNTGSSSSSSSSSSSTGSAGTTVIVRPALVSGGDSDAAGRRTSLKEQRPDRMPPAPARPSHTGFVVDQEELDKGGPKGGCCVLQ